MSAKGIDRARGMLGFAARAGKIVVGTELVCRAMAKSGNAKPRLVLISESSSLATKKKITVKSEFYGIKALEINLDTAELGRILGKTFTAAAVGITDEGFAEEIIRALSSPTKV